MILLSLKSHILSLNKKRAACYQHTAPSTGIWRFLNFGIHIYYDGFDFKNKVFSSFLLFIIIFPKIVIFPVLVRRCGMKNEKFNKYKAVEIHNIFQMLYKNSNGFVKIMSQGNRKGYFYNTEVLCNAEKLIYIYL